MVLSHSPFLSSLLKEQRMKDESHNMLNEQQSKNLLYTLIHSDEGLNLCLRHESLNLLQRLIYVIDLVVDNLL